MIIKKISLQYFKAFSFVMLWIGMDQWSKHAMRLTLLRKISITPFLSLSGIWNPGISFGMLADFPQVTGYGIPAFAVLVVIWLYFQLDQLSAIQRLGAGLIAGGALGNVVDRLRFDKVVDFIDVHLLGYHWPAFNIADSAIFIGVVAWLYGIMSTPKSEGDTHA